MKQRAEIEKEAIKAWKIETFQMISSFSSTLLLRYKTSALALAAEGKGRSWFHGNSKKGFSYL